MGDGVVTNGFGLIAADAVKKYLGAMAAEPPGLPIAAQEGRSVQRFFAPRVRPQFVRIGLLDRAAFGSTFDSFVPTVASRRAAFLLALSEINSRSDLLPYTQLRYALRDSQCDDQLSGLRSAVELVQDSFNGSGTAAIISATCSGVTKLAAGVASVNKVPIISASATSAELSSSSDFPSFLRTVPSDALQTRVMVDVLAHHFNYTQVALASTTDSYGIAGASSFFGRSSEKWP